MASGRREYSKTSGISSGGNSAEYSSREMDNPNLGALASAPTSAVPPMRGGGRVPKAGKGFLT